MIAALLAVLLLAAACWLSGRALFTLGCDSPLPASVGVPVGPGAARTERREPRRAREAPSSTARSRPRPGLLGPLKRGDAPVLELAAGLLLLHLLLIALQAVGLPWTRFTVAAAMALAGGGLVLALGRPRRGAGWPRTERREPRRAREARSSTARRPLGPAPVIHDSPSALWPPPWLPRWVQRWGDVLALAATAGFAAAALGLRATHPDLIYHWGVKAKKYLLAGGVDYTWLSHPWNHFIHPDYPNLVPETYAVSALFGGGFREPALLLWSVLLFAGLVLAGREALRRGGASPGFVQAGTAALALGAAAFSIGYLQAGGADLAIAMALVSGAASLAGAGSRGDDLALGIAAAFAAASKIEGVPLAGFLAALYLARQAWRRRVSWGVLARVLLPAALVVLPWAAANLRHGLFQPTNLGALDPGRGGAVLEGIAWSLTRPEWHGLAYLVLLLPLLLLPRRSRPLAALALLQLGFYLFVYLTTPMEVGVYIRSSFPRLLFHLLPAALLGAMLALAGRSGGVSARAPNA